MDLHSIRFSSAFSVFVPFSPSKRMFFFRPYFLYGMSISVLTRLSHTGQKFSKKNSCEGIQLNVEMSLSSAHAQNFYQYVLCSSLPLYIVRILNYKNADYLLGVVCLPGFSTPSVFVLHYELVLRNGRFFEMCLVKLRIKSHDCFAILYSKENAMLLSPERQV